jgi:hypothetical protein
MRGSIGCNSAMLLLLLLVVFPSSFAITINPLEYKIAKPELNKDYNVIITIINPEPNVATISAKIDQTSSYLSQYVKIQPAESIIIGPNEKQNIKLVINIPAGLSPETHNIIVNFYSLDLNIPIARFKLSFDIEGESLESLELEDMLIQSQTAEEPVYLTFELKNNGNVIAKPIPSIVIYKNDLIIDTFGEDSAISVLPGETYNFSLLYDPIKLKDAGSYAAEAKFIYGAGSETKSIKRAFDLKPKKTATESENEKKEVTEGVMFFTTVPIANPSGKLSFYKVLYNVEGTDINNVLEGELREENKDLGLEIDTSSLQPGNYKVNLEIQTGINLEKTEHKVIDLTVKKSTGYLFLIIIGSISLFVLVIFYFREEIILSFRLFLEKMRLRSQAGSILHSAKSNIPNINAPPLNINTPTSNINASNLNTSNLNIPALNIPNKSYQFPRHSDVNLIEKIKIIDDNIFTLTKEYSYVEGQFKSLGSSINQFISDSNDWLDGQYGPGRYGFK